MGSFVSAWSGDAAFTMVTYACNNRCTFCSLETVRRERRTPSPEEVRAFVDEAAAAGCRTLEFVGGEVTILPELEALIAYARGRFETITVLSNGRRLGDAAFCRRIVEAGLTSVGVSLHGSCAAIHDPLSRVEGAFAETVRGIENLVALSRERRLEVWVTTTLRPENLADLVPLGERLRALGVPKWLLRFPTGRAFLLPYHEALPAIHAALAAHGAALDVRTENLPLCVLRPYAHHSGDLAGRAGLEVHDHALVATTAPQDRRDRLPECRRCAAAALCAGPEDTYRETWGARGLQPLGPDEVGAIRAAARQAEEARAQRAPARGDPVKAAFERIGDRAAARDWQGVRAACDEALAALPGDPEVLRMRRMAAGHLLHDEAQRLMRAGREAEGRRLLERVRRVQEGLEEPV